MGRRRVQTVVDWVFRFENINGGVEDASHLHRWCLFALPRGIRLYLHHFVDSDFARDPHDHPKGFLSIGLRGGYLEETPREEMGVKQYSIYIAPWLRYFPPQHIHRILLPEGKDCWTLALTGPVRREWGFWHAGRWIEWRQYIYGGRRS